MRDFLLIKTEQYYRELGGSLKFIPDKDDIVFNNLEEWYNYPHKYEILNEALKINNKLGDLTKPNWYKPKRTEMGMFRKAIYSSVYIGDVRTIDCMIEELDKAINGNEYIGTVPKSLICTDIGYSFLNEIKSISSFSDNAFFHTKLRYDSFIVNNNKLVGITNWEYAGYYPKELINIIQCYIDYI